MVGIDCFGTAMSAISQQTWQTTSQAINLDEKLCLGLITNARPLADGMLILNDSLLMQQPSAMRFALTLCGSGPYQADYSSGTRCQIKR